MVNLRLERVLSNSAIISTEKLLREAKDIADQEFVSKKIKTG
jgi:hypothetical protein